MIALNTVLGSPSSSYISTLDTLSFPIQRHSRSSLYPPLRSTISQLVYDILIRIRALQDLLLSIGACLRCGTGVGFTNRLRMINKLWANIDKPLIRCGALYNYTNCLARISKLPPTARGGTTIGHCRKWVKFIRLNKLFDFA